MRTSEVSHGRPLKGTAWSCDQKQAHAQAGCMCAPASQAKWQKYKTKHQSRGVAQSWLKPLASEFSEFPGNGAQPLLSFVWRRRRCQQSGFFVVSPGVCLSLAHVQAGAGVGLCLTLPPVYPSILHLGSARPCSARPGLRHMPGSLCSP